MQAIQQILQIIGILITIPFFLYLPGYLINKIYTQKKEIDAILISITISISIIILIGIPLSLIKQLNFITLTIIYTIINAGLIIKWKYQ